MTLEAICGLDVVAMADAQAHLWLWTTATFLWDAPRVALSWGFRPTYTLVWAKNGLGVGGRFRHTVEYVIFAERGAQLPITRRDLPTHWIWPKGEHSSKPDAFYDLVESVSPTPRLEMFSRRSRLGWDSWGDEALNHVTLGAA
jgi:N6-adenosine-specific RNA methylase IME4